MGIYLGQPRISAATESKKVEKDDENRIYSIYGAILGCLGSHTKEVEYTVTEELKDDPWKAIIKSKGLLTFEEVKKWHKLHVTDVDKKGVPYYFMVKNTKTKLEYVWYSDDAEWMPVNTKAEKKRAKEAGVRKKLVEEQLDF